RASYFHLSRQMKVTKAKALSIFHSGVATRVRPMGRHATAQRRTPAAIGNRADAQRGGDRGRCEATTASLLGPLVSRRAAQGFAGRATARFNN
ncbi:MAG TPA: hypothetical protein VHQ87_05200, partial [Rhizobacter sp.]|nr:hypothetical protein [Rhizobacter sp.]